MRVLAKLIFLGPLLIFFPLTGCVSSGKYQKLEAEHNAAVDQMNVLKDNAEKSKTQISELETLNSQLERQLGKASDDKESMRASITQMKQALKEMSERKRETEKRMAEFRELVRRLQSLTKSGQLTIKIVDGRMVVALPGDVLFRSGSAKLSDAGQSTIQQVTQILKDINSRNFQVEGHTDNVPIKTAQFPSNWELASQRATNVVREMLTAGMPQERISVASFAETRPVASNDTAEGRQLNRRIEIVLVPDMSALPGYDELTKMAEDSKPKEN
ncbi:MAG: flagellar motor protein MotB [Bdellovibrionales bacterium]|nr:flagellar motor protein MotB [Bdellovibrionales bacterium]